MENFSIILWGALGTLVTALVTWLGSYIIGLLNAKIKDQKLRTFLTKFTELMMSCVNAVTQTTVATLKEEKKFDEAAAKKVKEECIKLIQGQLSTDMVEFITANYGDVKEFISTQIESYILQSKR